MFISGTFQFSSTTEAVPDTALVAFIGGRLQFQFSSTTEAVPERVPVVRHRHVPVSILEHDRSRARVENTITTLHPTAFQFSSTTEAVPETMPRTLALHWCFNSRARPKPCPNVHYTAQSKPLCFNSRARPKPCPSASYEVVAQLAQVSILEHDRSRARYVAFFDHCVHVFQFSSTTEAVPERSAQATGFLARVSILEHDRSRARNRDLEFCNRPPSFNSRARPKPCPKTLHGKQPSDVVVSILEHDRSRARPNAFATHRPLWQFQFSSTTEAVPEYSGAASTNPVAMFQFSSTTEAVPDGACRAVS